MGTSQRVRLVALRMLNDNATWFIISFCPCPCSKITQLQLLFVVRIIVEIVRTYLGPPRNCSHNCFYGGDNFTQISDYFSSNFPSCRLYGKVIGLAHLTASMENNLHVTPGTKEAFLSS